jgi:hypothetical protein
VAERKTKFSELNGSTSAQIKFALDLSRGQFSYITVAEKYINAGTVSFR